MASYNVIDKCGFTFVTAISPVARERGRRCIAQNYDYIRKDNLVGRSLHTSSSCGPGLRHAQPSDCKGRVQALPAPSWGGRKRTGGGVLDQVRSGAPGAAQEDTFPKLL